MFEKLSELIEQLLVDVFNMIPQSPLYNSVHFFLYDSIKILLLLSVIVSLMTFVNSYFPVEKVRDYLSTRKLYGFQYLMASLFGVVTPFCSCSSVPLFIGFVRAGIPLGVTFSFLVTSPLVNEVAVALFLGLFGVKITLLYILSGVVLGTVSGLIINWLKLESNLESWISEVEEGDIVEEAKISFKQRLNIARFEMVQILGKVTPYVIVGIAIGAVIHGYVPESFFSKMLANDGIWSVPLATLASIPMYMNASGAIPVVEVLVSKGVPMGTALSFMMGMVALSFPEAVLLKNVMNLKLLTIFFSIVAFGIILIGYLFNFIIA